LALAITLATGLIATSDASLSSARNGGACDCTGPIQIVFSGSGSATMTQTNTAGGSTTDTDSFSWIAIYDLPSSDFPSLESAPSGWNPTDVRADSTSTFNGTAAASCTPPSGGGTCVEPGGGTSCQGNFANSSGVPLTLLAYSPLDHGVVKLAAPAFSSAQTTSGCFPTAISDTCDPLYSGPYPGQGENGPVTAQFNLDLNNPDTTQSSPVSESQSWHWRPDPRLRQHSLVRNGAAQLLERTGAGHRNVYVLPLSYCFDQGPRSRGGSERRLDGAG
jgi:hypothetical protein